MNTAQDMDMVAWCEGELLQARADAARHLERAEALARLWGGILDAQADGHRPVTLADLQRHAGRRGERGRAELLATFDRYLNTLDDTEGN